MDETTMTERILRGFGNSSVLSVFSPDSGILAFYVQVAGSNAQIEIWDTQRNNWIAPASGMSWYITAIAFSSNGQYLVAGTGNELGIWKLPTVNTPHRKIATNDRIRVILASHPTDDRTIATAMDSGAVQLWDCESGVRTVRLDYGIPHSSGSPYWMAFSSNGNCLASDRGRHIHIWDTASWHLQQILPESYFAEAALSSDGRVIATATSKNKALVVELWDTRTGALLRERHGDTSGSLDTLNFSQDDHLEARSWSGSGSTWRECLPNMRMKSALFTAIGFTQDGRWLASGASHNGHGDIVLWDTSTGRRGHELYNLESVPLAVQLFERPGETVLMIGFQDGTVWLKVLPGI
jgi:WD40 repeat protein